MSQRTSGTATRQREEEQEQEQEQGAELSISSVGGQALLSEREVCDEFVCTSSPVVASHVRQIVADIQQRRDLAERAASYIADSIEFSDNWISLRGREAYAAHDLWKSGFLQPGLAEKSLSSTFVHVMYNCHSFPCTCCSSFFWRDMQAGRAF